MLEYPTDLTGLVHKRLSTCIYPSLPVYARQCTQELLGGMSSSVVVLHAAAGGHHSSGAARLQGRAVACVQLSCHVLMHCHPTVMHSSAVCSGCARQSWHAGG
jgi:hypothetical protein